jgi:hypothetical protein
MRECLGDNDPQFAPNAESLMMYGCNYKAIVILKVYIYSCIAPINIVSSLHISDGFESAKAGHLSRFQRLESTPGPFSLPYWKPAFASPTYLDLYRQGCNRVSEGEASLCTD